MGKKYPEVVVEFVAKVTKEGGPDFVPPTERITVFDNDGTLWAEQLMYFQFLFALDRVKALAPQHPEWKTNEPVASLLRGDVKSSFAGGERAMLEIVMATHAGMATDEFNHVGRRPIAAFGNSDGDQQMLEWTTAGSGARFALILHHTDAEREWAYDRSSTIGKLDKAWNGARAKGWTVVNMKDDWKRIFGFEQQ